MQFYQQPPLQPGYLSPPEAQHGGFSQQQQQSGVDPWAHEPPLLEELGIDFSDIAKKTMAILNPKAAAPVFPSDDSDLAGPLVYCLGLGAFLLLQGKMAFGYIYGFGVLGSFLLYLLFNLMLQHESISLDRVFTIMGYSLAPLLVLAFLSIFFTFKSVSR